MDFYWQLAEIYETAKSRGTITKVVGEILLSEVHHRVKNNLAVISGLLQLERFQADDENVINVLRTSESVLYPSEKYTNCYIRLYPNGTFRDPERGSKT